MKIGVMLRAYDRAGGIGIYSRNIIKHLLDIDRSNQYVLMYNKESHIGTYNYLDNVEEVCLPEGNPLYWDQIHVPKIIKSKGIDLLFNTKFSVPFMTNVPKIMVLHGASWFVKPDLYKKMDILYVRFAIPFYCRLASFLISNSELTTNDYLNLLNISREKIETVRLAPGDSFAPVQDLAVLDMVREKYSLPRRFILTVTSYDPRKNFATLVDAFRKCREQEDVHLVVVGKNCVKYIKDFDLIEKGLGDYVHFPGWVDQADLPSLYSLASVFSFPSVYEEFGIPLVESLACGCPVASSDTGAIPELSKGAALLADPFDVEAQTSNILRILQSPQVAEQLRECGLERAKDFSWNKAAQQTLQIFSRFSK